MPNPKIKWRAEEREQIAREVKRFNAKVEREARKAGNIVPPKMETKNVRAMIKTRADFNAFKKLVENAFKEGAFKEGKTGSTKYERAEVQIRTGIINRKRAARAEKRPIPEGKMGTETQNRNQPKKPKSLRRLGAHAADYLKSLRYESSGEYEQDQNNTYLENYLSVASRYIDPKYMRQIEYALKKIPTDAFIAAKEDGNEMDIDFVYDQQADPSLGYQVTKALFGLMDNLGIKHKAMDADEIDIERDNNATIKEPEDED